MVDSPFTPKFDKLPLELRNKIIHRARTMGSLVAAKEFYQEAGMNERALRNKLRKMTGENEEPKSTGLPNGKPPEKELSSEEMAFLDKLTKGEVSITEMSRFVGRQVFEKMLRNPNDIRFIDFFRTELIRQKEDESKVKDAWAKEVIARFFAGKLPPRFCPKCGHDLSVTQDEAPIAENKDEDVADA